MKAFPFWLTLLVKSSYLVLLISVFATSGMRCLYFHAGWGQCCSKTSRIQVPERLQRCQILRIDPLFPVSTVLYVDTFYFLEEFLLSWHSWCWKHSSGLEPSWCLGCDHIDQRLCITEKTKLFPESLNSRAGRPLSWCLVMNLLRSVWCFHPLVLDCLCRVA